MKRLLFALILAIPLACTSKHIPVIFDTDMGNDIDDALALAMLYRTTDFVDFGVTVKPRYCGTKATKLSTLLIVVLDCSEPQ